VPLSVSAVEISAITHATEDPSRVEAAASLAIPKELAGAIKFSRSHALGHYGNPITVIRAKLTRRKHIDLYIRELASLLDEEQKRELGLTIRGQIDESGSMYVRLDKQAAYQGRVRFASRDPVRIKIRFVGWPITVEDIVKSCREAGLIS